MFRSIKNFLNNARFSPAISSHNSLTTAEIRFMIYANGHETDISTFSNHYNYEYGLDYKHTLQRLLNCGYLKIGDADESLTLYTVNELKKYLKSNNLPVSGKKDALISRILDSGLDYSSHFTKRIYHFTEDGYHIAQEYESNRIAKLKQLLSDSIYAIRHKQYGKLISLYKSNADPKNPISLPYDENGIKKDATAIIEYTKIRNSNDRELAISIVAVMFKKSFSGALEILSDLGYNDVTDSEIHTAFTSICSLQCISELKSADIKKYRISSCGDGRVCEKCSKMDGKIFSISNAQLGKNLPPFCEECRCIINPIFSE